MDTVKAKTRKVLSFDVGIINLAYCLLEIDDDNQTFKILKWGIIDLADNRNVCSYIKNTGDFCNKIAKFAIKLNQHNNHYYCKDHVKKAELYVKPINIKWYIVEPEDVEYCTICTKNLKSKITNKTYDLYACNSIDGQYCLAHQKEINNTNKYICVAKKCTKLIKHGLYYEQPDIDDYEIQHVLEYGWCNDHFDEEYRALLNKKTKKISQNSNKISLISLGSSMYRQLDKYPELLMVDLVLIENQPTLINPTMKSVANMLFSYFIMRGIHEKKNNSTISSVEFCCPANKITVGGKKVTKKLEDAAENKVYKLTKSLGVKFCKALISDNDEWLNMLTKYKKQDDMADAFLQGIVRTFGSHLPDHYAEKIKNVDINVNINKETKNTQKYDVDYEVESKNGVLRIGKQIGRKEKKYTKDGSDSES